MVVLGVLLAGSCRTPMTRTNVPIADRDINAVLADHDDELLAISGVVGVCVGLMPDQKTACLKVMLERKDPTLVRSLPRQLEGYPVVTEVTGPIKPIRQ